MKNDFISNLSEVAEEIKEEVNKVTHLIGEDGVVLVTIDFKDNAFNLYTLNRKKPQFELLVEMCKNGECPVILLNETGLNERLNAEKLVNIIRKTMDSHFSKILTNPTFREFVYKM